MLFGTAGASPSAASQVGRGAGKGGTAKVAQAVVQAVEAGGGPKKANKCWMHTMPGYAVSMW